MLAQWTGDIVGKMHLYRITKKQLAEKLGFSAEYVSMVLNGRKHPKGAQCLFNSALDELITEQNTASSS